MGSISGSINFQGISGTDFGTMVDGLKEAELIPKMQMEAWHNDWEKRYDAFEDLLVGFKDLQTALKELNTIGKIIQKEVASSEDSVATAKADSNAENGTTSVTVNKLATNSAYSFAEKFDKDTVVTKFTATDQMHEFKYTHDGKEHSVSVPSGTTMEQLMKTINDDPTNPGVSASLVKNGDQYTFQLQSDETGLDSELVFDPAANDELISFGAVNHRPAQDAEFYLNGWDTNIITSSSNQLEEVVTGLDITLISVGTAELTVTQSTEGIKEKVTEFVDATNKLLKMFNDFTAIEEAIEGTSTDSDDNVDNDTTTGAGDTLYNPQGGVLTGNYGIQMLESQLKSILGGGLTGSTYYDPLTGTGDEFRTLASIGIVTDSEQGSDTFGQLIFIEDDEEDNEDKPDLDPARNATLDFVNEYTSKDAIVIAGDAADPDATPPVAGDPDVDFKYTYKDVEHIVKVPAGSTLEELIDAINDDPNNDGNVTATTVASGGSIQLRLSGDDKGADADLTVERGQTGVNIGGYLKTDAKDASKDPFRTLDDILEDDPLAVANLLAGTKTSSSSNYFSYSGKVPDITQPGNHTVTYDVDDDGNLIEDSVMIGGFKATKNEGIPGAWNSENGDSEGLRIIIHASPAGTTVNGSINMQEGKIKELEKFLVKESKPGNADDATTPGFEKGSLHILKDNYEVIMDNIQKKIESEIARVERWEVVQRAHYARLDALLMDYQNKMNSNASSLAKMQTIG